MLVPRLKNLSISRSILFFISFILLTVLGTWTLVTFNFFSRTTNTVVETSSREINKQIILNYESYIFNIIDVGNYLREETLNETRENRLSSLKNTFETMDESNTYIRSISLLQSNGEIVTGSEGLKETQTNVSNNEWFLLSLSDESLFHFSAPHEEDIYIGGNRQVITVSRLVEFYQDNVLRNGVLVIEVELDNFSKIKDITNLGENGHIVITDEYFQTVFTNKISCADSVCESIDFMEQQILGGQYVDVNDIHMYMNVNTISLTRWRIATFVNAESLTDARETLLISFLVALVASLAISVLVSSLFSRRITSPIYKLNEYMKEFERGSIHSKVHIEGQKELVELSDSFNHMIDQIYELMTEVMQEQRAKRKTHFIALQNQINPHFLYNTLDSILYLNESNQPDDVEKMIVALSKFFRSSISTEQNIIPLRDEIEHVKSYLLIQKIRYHERFSYTFDIAEEVLDFGVLKLGLQPIVENAIYHGIDPDGEQNYIHISTTITNDEIHVEVKNNGYGISQEKIDSIYSNFNDNNESKHIGLRNINQRLKLYYGFHAKVEIESILDEYTIVRMVYPKKREDKS